MQRRSFNAFRRGCGSKSAFKAVAARHEMGLGDLLEGIVLHAFEGKAPFEDDTLAFIEQMRAAYGLDLTADDSHGLCEG